MSVKLDLSGILGTVGSEELLRQDFLTEACSRMVHEKTGIGNDFLGWVNLPFDYDAEEMERIKKAAARIRSDSEVLLVIGIGGSYLGARAALEFIHSPLYNNLKKDGLPDIYFVGNSLSSGYLNDVAAIIGDRDFSVNVISKSGTTTEPAVAFRVFKEKLEERYGKDGARRRIYATTDRSRGALKKLCDAEGYETFVIPDDVGGRFSVLTPVGLLPLAAAGIEIDAIMQGAQDACKKYAVNDIEKNDCLKYAAARHCLYNRGKRVEIFVNYDPSLMMFGEWLKQLYAESQGKDNKGLFPVSANFSTDLHSIGQYIQEGSRILFETVLWVKENRSEAVIKKDPENIDGLNFLAGKTMQYVNGKAFQGTLLAHVDGGAPNIVLEIDRADAYHFGFLVYFFELACGIGGYMLGINPFDQPGVESYKENMFALLGKPGYEEEMKKLSVRLP